MARAAAQPLRQYCFARLFRLIAVLAPAFLLAATEAQTYYVSPTGNDNNSGLDPSAPWRTVAKVNDTAFAPGSTILFQRGGQWREKLIASSSGQAGNPITYDAYGSGAKPRFFGSDVMNKTAFQPVVGSSSAYSLITTPVHSVLVNQQFMRSAQLVSGASDPTANINFVKSNPNTWYYDAGRVYVNTGGINPHTDSRTYTAVSRDDVVYSNYKNHLVFRNLIVDESAQYNRGYAFRVEGSRDVLIEASEAYRAGKHHFGVINSTEFVGRQLYAAIAMPDQGFGGASHYVSYSDYTRSNDTSEWIDAVADLPNGPYPGFVTHGEGMGDILIKNMTVRGGVGMAVYTEGSNQEIRIEGGLVENGNVGIFNNTTVDGITVTGPSGSISLGGINGVVQNSTITGRSPDYWAGSRAAIVDSGQNNTIRFNTISLDPNFSGRGAGIAINSASSNTAIYGNVLTDPHAILLFGGAAPLDSYANLYAPGSLFGIFQPNGAVTQYSFAEWQQLGYEVKAAMIGDADFDGDIDADDYALIDRGFATGNLLAGFHNGDFNLSGGAPDADDYFLIDRAFAQQWLQQSSVASQQAAPEPSSIAMLIVGAWGLAIRRRVPRLP